MYVPFFSPKPSSTHVKHYGSDEALISGHVHYSMLRLSKHLNEIICTNGLVVKLAVAIGQPPVRFRVSANSYLFALFCLFFARCGDELTLIGSLYYSGYSAWR